MSLNEIKDWDDLVKAAEFFGTDIPASSGNKNTDKKNLREALEEDGVTIQQVKQYITDVEIEEPEPVKEPETKEEAAEEDLVLIRMTRENPRFDVYGYTFTKANPFALVKGELVDRLLGNYEGFRPASPSEVKEFFS